MHYIVLGLNESSSEDNIKKVYRSLACQFHLEKNQHSQFSDVMLMINEAKEELEDTFRNNYAMREKEHFRMAQNTIVI